MITLEGLGPLRTVSGWVWDKDSIRLRSCNPRPWLIQTYRVCRPTLSFRWLFIPCMQNSLSSVLVLAAHPPPCSMQPIISSSSVGAGLIINNHSLFYQYPSPYFLWAIVLRPLLSQACGPFLGDTSYSPHLIGVQGIHQMAGDREKNPSGWDVRENFDRACIECAARFCLLALWVSVSPSNSIPWSHLKQCRTDGLLKLLAQLGVPEAWLGSVSLIPILEVAITFGDRLHPGL